MAESLVLLMEVPESGKQCDHPNKLVTGPHIVTLTTSAMHLVKLIDRENIQGNYKQVIPLKKNKIYNWD